MKKIIAIIFIIPVFFASCTKDIDRFNVETKKAANVPAETLFSNAVRNAGDALASGSVNTNPLRFTVKHWAMAVYQDEAQYNFATRNIPQSWWTIMYRDVLSDLKEAARIINANTSLDAGTKANQLAMIDVMQVYIYEILVSSFGDIPYSEALDADILFPKYDDAKTVYTDLLKRVADAASKFNTASGGMSASADLVYAGNITKWKKFANSLRMKMAMTIADADAALSKSHFEAADPGAFTSSADDAKITYLGATPNTNPLYADIVLGGRGDYVAATDLMTHLVNMNDPRKQYFFGVNNAGMYQGGVVGRVNTYSDMSKPGTKVSAATAPVIFLDYVEVEFYRAEAKERGYNVAGTAADHYNNAIRASILFWGGTNAEADAYLARPDVAYATAAGDWKQKIGFQKWIALYNRPVAGWTELRRLDHPALSLAVGAVSGFPNRYQYPNNEQQLNGSNYSAASSKIGGDNPETKIFWDKF